MTLLFSAFLAASLSVGHSFPAPVMPSVQPFPLANVKLLDGPFQHAHEKCIDYLLTVDPDRLLHSFRKNSGLEPKGKIYGGWEDTGLAGHSLGHYLTACSQEFANSHDARYKAKVDYIVSELTACQVHRSDGYIAAMPDGDRVWNEVRKGDIRSHGFDLNGLWSPWYTHHKVLAGLLDAYHLTGNKPALTSAKKFADWMVDLTKNLTDAQWQLMLGCEYGGMNDSLAELYSVTKETKYLDLARKFYDKRVLDPLAEGKDELAGKHSNTQIPKIIGLAHLYELTGDPRDKRTAEVFWDKIVHHHTYAIGGNSNHEYLGPADQLSEQLSTNTCETCNTYNMLKLTRHLFEWDPKPEYADFYERAHVNHILGSQNPNTAMMTYFMPLVSGGFRNYSNPFDDWTCCHGSGMENHTKHADSVYFHKGGEKLYVNLFMPTELTWKEAGLTIRQSTQFPLDGKVTLTIEKGKAHMAELLIRHPYWATSPVTVKVNGAVTATSSTASSYISVKHYWKAGDKIEFTLPMSLHTQPMPDNPNRVALMEGPIVLAAKLGTPNDPDPRTPVLVTNQGALTDWLVPGDKPLTYKTKGAGRPGDLEFGPFYAMNDVRYAVYFDLFTQEQWNGAEAEFRAEEARQKDLQDRTLDYIRVGEMQPERDHNLKSEKNDVRDSNGRGFRTPLAGGWFECELTVNESPTDLVFTYWGNERYKPHFDILIDGQKVVEETLPHLKPNKFFDETVSLPNDLTKGKKKIVVRINAINNTSAGSVAGIRAVRRP